MIRENLKILQVYLFGTECEETKKLVKQQGPKKLFVTYTKNKLE